MNFEDTGLPGSEIFKDAFAAGWAHYFTRYNDDFVQATRFYSRGPLAMARLIHQHGGQGHDVAAAASLAGPALFSKSPLPWLTRHFGPFYQEINRVNVNSTKALSDVLPGLSDTARVFLQSAAVMLLEHVATGCENYSCQQKRQMYLEAVELYSISRGSRDNFKLDGCFEESAARVLGSAEKPVVFAGGAAGEQATANPFVHF